MPDTSIVWGIAICGALTIIIFTLCVIQWVAANRRSRYNQTRAERLSDLWRKECLKTEILRCGYRAINCYLNETRDRGKSSPVGRHVREMIEIMALGVFDLQPTEQSESMREGLEEQIFLNHMTPEQEAKMVRIS